MTTISQAAAQLSDELGGVATSLAALLGADLAPMLADRAREAAPRLVAELDAVQFPDETALDILAVLWPTDDPDLDWWSTPLGLLIAPLWAAHQDPDAGWTHAEAAAVLGVTRGTVAQLVTRGDIDRTSDGSCSRAAVLARLVRLAGARA